MEISFQFLVFSIKTCKLQKMIKAHNRKNQQNES